jgi:hypothetical protein
MFVVPKITDNMYLRIGQIPQNERSGIYKGYHGKIGEEQGVSCYRGVVVGNKVYIIMPHVASTTYYWLIDEYNRGKTPLYIIDGDEVGLGSDDEPVLRNVKIIREIFDWEI